MPDLDSPLLLPQMHAHTHTPTPEDTSATAAPASSNASAVDLDAIEQQKENIQPLTGGRSAKALHSLFTSDRKQVQDELREGHERFKREIDAVETDGHDDPLDVYHRCVLAVRSDRGHGAVGGKATLKKVAATSKSRLPPFPCLQVRPMDTGVVPHRSFTLFAPRPFARARNAALRARGAVPLRHPPAQAMAPVCEIRRHSTRHLQVPRGSASRRQARELLRGVGHARRAEQQVRPAQASLPRPTNIGWPDSADGSILRSDSLPSADSIYNLGIARRAQPLERLKKRREAFQARMLLPRAQQAMLEQQQEREQGRHSAPGAARSMLGASAPRGSAVAPQFKGTAAANASAKTALPNNGAAGFAVFKDDEHDAATQPRGSGGSQEGWTDFGTNALRKRENVQTAVTWKGETLPMLPGATSLAGAGKIQVFRDEVRVISQAG